MADQKQQQEPSSVVPSDPLQQLELLGVPSTPTDGSTAEDGSKSSDENAKKIFVGGLPHYITREEITDYFVAYGTVFDAIIVFDQSTGKARGFGFVTFDSKDAVNRVLQNRYHELKGKQVEVKRAFQKNRTSNGTTSYTDNRRGFGNASYHLMYGPIYQNCYPQPQNWVMGDGFSGYASCPRCGHIGYSNYYDFYNYAGDYGLYNGWAGDQWMNDNGKQHNYGSYVQNPEPSTRPNGHFVSTNGYGNDHDLQNGITRRVSVASSVDPLEVVAGVGELKLNESVPARTESIVAVNGTTDEQQPPEIGEEDVGQSDL